MTKSGDGERALAEQGARDGERTTQERLLEAVAVGCVRVGADGSIEHANAIALDFLGFKLDAITHQYTGDFTAYKEDGALCPMEEFPVSQTLMTGAKAGPMTLGVARPDGGMRWAVFTSAPLFGEDGTLTAALVTFADITSRRKAEEKLRESEAWLWAYLNSSPTQICFLDRDLKFVFLNRYEYGHTPESIHGQDITDFLPPADRDRVVDCLTTVLETGIPASYELPPFEGVYPEWYSTVAAPVRKDGEIVGVVLNSSNITDRVELQSRLLVADRLAALGTLAAGVAHEINNPLTYVMANMDRACKEVANRPDSDAVVSWLRDAVEGAGRIRNVVRDLSSLAAPTKRRTGTVDVRLVLRAAMRMVRVELQHRARLVAELDEVPAVRADESQLFQVFLNLLINAAQAISVGDATANEVRVSTSIDDDGWVVIAISDTGVGIEADLRTRIFEPFVTSKLDDRGTGLGLFVSSTLIKGLGGRLVLASEVGEPTTFHVILPPSQKRVDTEPPVLPRGAPEAARVLVVDDEPGVLMFMKDALRDHEVVLASSGQEALEAFASGEFDIVFCDIIMPEMSGIDVFRRIEESDPETASRFVLITGGAFTPDASRFVAETKLPVLEKPFLIVDILESISRMLSSRGARADC